MFKGEYVVSKVKAKIELIKKAFRKWAVDYHFVIPPAILKQYMHKFFHENANINKYSVRYYDPHKQEEYQKWLTLQQYSHATPDFTDIAFVCGGNCKETSVNVHTINELPDLKEKYICFLGDNVTLYPEFFHYLSKCKKYDFTYFDHDTMKNGERCEPVLKPDFSYNTLRGYNYIGNCWIVKKELLLPLVEKYHEMYRWLLELSDMDILFGHIQKILYCDTECIGDQSDVVRDYFTDHAIKADVCVNEDGISRTVWYVYGNPKVSIVIPTKDGKEVLKVCIDSIYAKTTYQNFEIIIADNGSVKAETAAYFEELKREHNNIKICRIECPFNFSLINNRAVEQATGDYILMLNNDTSVITPDWLEKMLSYCTRENVGSVGVKLWYPDDTIQHGGVIIGKGGAAAHRYYRCPHNQRGYLYTLEMPNDVSCNTAACLMIKRSVWNKLHGMNEELPVQFNDVDLEIRIMKAGYYNVFLPMVELYHYESKSRGIDKSKTAVERYVMEVNHAKKEWADLIAHDPFYNDNFDKNYDYQLIVGDGSN